MILARAFLHLCSSRQRILQCWAISCANNLFLQGKKMSIFYAYVKKAYKLQRSRSSCLYQKTLIGPINRILGLISEQILTSKTLPLLNAMLSSQNLLPCPHGLWMPPVLCGSFLLNSFKITYNARLPMVQGVCTKHIRGQNFGQFRPPPPYVDTFAK